METVAKQGPGRYDPQPGDTAPKGEMMDDQALAFLAPMVLLSAGLAAGEKPWDPGVEKPSEDALASALYIHPVPEQERASLKFTVTEGAGIMRKREPVRGGIPFARGELKGPDNIRLLDPSDKEIPLQGRVTSFWPEGTVRWLCIDFLTDIDARQTKTFTLEYGGNVRSAQASSLAVKGKTESISIETGKMQIAFARGERFAGTVVRPVGGLRGEIVGRLVLSRGRPDSDPVTLPLHVDEVELVESGPVQATVYLKGGYGREKVKEGVYRFPFHASARVYGDSCRMEVIHSFGFNGDENADFVRRYGLVLPASAGDGNTFVYGGELGGVSKARLTNRLTLRQDRHDRWTLSGDAHAAGRRFGGWAALADEEGYTTVALRNAWQQWPVTLEATAEGELAVYIYGAPEGECLDFRYEGENFGKSRSMYVGETFSSTYGGGKGRAPGLLKISELVMDLGGDPADVGGGAHVPLVPFAGPERIAETKALGHIGTYAASKAAGFDTDGLRRWASAILDFPVIQHEANGLYGWVDWPDQADCNPPRGGRFQLIMKGGIGWTNSERALLSYYFHYAAGGAEKYLHLGHAMTLHTIGIDLEHPGGEAPAGKMHRHSQVHWRTPAEPRQCGIRGWVVDYWMTGNPEVYRILTEVYFPNQDYCPRPGTGPDTVVVCSKSGSWNCPNLMAYLTTNDPVWIKHHKAIDAAIFEAASKGLAIPYSPWRGGRMTWKDGRIGLKNCKPGTITGYWLTYGGDDRLAGHASLFGYDISIKALKAWGGSLWGEGQKPPGLRSYHSPEAGAAAYYLLTRNPRALAEMTGRIKRGRRSIKGEPFDWDTYTVSGTADDWHGLIGQGYGKNGFKIAAANVYESVYALAAIEFSEREASAPRR